MIQRLRLATLVASTTVFLSLSGVARAADDPSIQGETRSGIHAAMKAFIADQRSGGWMIHYDPVVGELLRLRLVELHDGIVQKGHFYVSCADFVDERGRPIDMDFLVLPREGAFRVNQAIVHKVAGKKRKYHVEQRWPGLF